MSVELTSRDFEIINFEDDNGNACTLQRSSAIDDTPRGFDQPGSSFVWLGRGDERMHLNRQQVAELIGVLRRWRKTGSFKEPRPDGNLTVTG